MHIEGRPADDIWLDEVVNAHDKPIRHRLEYDDGRDTVRQELIELAADVKEAFSVLALDDVVGQPMAVDLPVGLGRFERVGIEVGSGIDRRIQGQPGSENYHPQVGRTTAS